MFKDKEKEFLEAYEKYADDIYRHCYFRVYNKELAEDLTQETFIKTWKYIVAGQKIGNIKAFLYRVAVNLVIDNSRKKKEIYLDNMEIKGDPGSIRLNNIEGEIFNRIEVGEILKVLDDLPENYRQVIVMRYVNDLMPQEIADILNETPNAVSVRINQAVSKLRGVINNKKNERGFN
jgi:RNA polymerase sigma-70 factor (ECF subfamily)